MTDFVDWNVEKKQQEKSLLSSRLFRELIEVFKFENISKWHQHRQKTQKIPICKVFMQFLSNFR